MLSAGLLAACESTSEIRAGTVDQVCKQWLPTSISKKDILTQQTAAEIAGNNAANRVWCGVRPVEKQSSPSRVAAKSPRGAEWMPNRSTETEHRLTVSEVHIQQHERLHADHEIRLTWLEQATRGLIYAMGLLATGKTQDLASFILGILPR